MASYRQRGASQKATRHRILRGVAATFAVFGSWLLISIGTCADNASYSNEQSFTTLEQYAKYCGGRGLHQMHQSCLVPFETLLSRGELFSQKRVTIRGVLVLEHGREPILFPTCESARYSSASGIRIDVPVTTSLESIVKGGVGPIYVEGTFRTLFPRRTEGSPHEVGSGLPGYGLITEVSELRLYRTPQQQAAYDEREQAATDRGEEVLHKELWNARDVDLLKPRREAPLGLSDLPIGAYCPDGTAK
jgi:hypothetical protein